MDERENKGRIKLNYRKINDILKLSNKLLKVIYVLVAILTIYVCINIFKELKILDFILEVLGIVAPLFIGIAIAWLFNPIVKWFEKHKIKRIFGVLFVYIVLLGAIGLMIGSLVPILYDEIVSFASSIPSMVTGFESTLTKFLNKFNGIDGINSEVIREKIFSNIEVYGNNLSDTLPATLLSVGKTIISGVSDFVVGLIIGFFLLLSFDSVNDSLAGLVPKRHKKSMKELTDSVDKSLKNYVAGVLIDAVVILFICLVAFTLVGLRAPLLFAIFCAITNVIPYIGPYIGAVPALIVAFSTSPTVGLLTLVSIVVIQFFEGNFLQEYLMSKTTKLHPVTIIIGLLVFGHYFGMLGMIISTPLIAVCKELFKFMDKKYNFFDRDEGELVDE